MLAAHSGEVLTYSDEDPPTEDPPTEDPRPEDPPTEDPPAEDPPAEDPPAEDPPAEDAPEPSSDVDVVSSSLAGGRVRPGRWSRIRVVLANSGDATAPRGVLRAGGRGVQGRRRAVPALSAGEHRTGAGRRARLASGSPCPRRPPGLRRGR